MKSDYSSFAKSPSDEETDMFYGALPILFEFAKELRGNQTDAEKYLWNYLKRGQILNLRFKRQHPVSYFIADFYCHKAKLIIEVDGGYHKLPQQYEYDINRDSELMRFGLKVLRFTNERVLFDTEKVVQEITEEVKMRIDNKPNSTQPALKYGGKSPLQGRFRGVIIGIDDNRAQYFSPEVSEILQSHTIFSGGVRHYEIVKPYLPQNHTWIYVTVPLTDVFEQYKSHNEVVIFASGDPLFYGFANTVLREMPQADIRIFPSFNSLQLLAHRLLMPYHDMHIVSLTGRPWEKFDEALILGYEKIGILTDNREHTPATIAARMLDYGYDNYAMFVGEKLGNSEEEKVTEWRLEDVVEKTFESPNNLILRKNDTNRPRPFGIPESDFHLLNGRAKMITKMPVRLLSLSFLDLRNRKVFWDVGFCTGSVSIEAKLHFPHLRVVSFEKRADGEQLMHDNARKFGAPGIETVIGDFTQTDISTYPKPDAVFIGGHGGKMHEIVAKISEVLTDNGVIVFNSVSDESRQMFLDAIKSQNLNLRQSTRLQVDDFNAIDVMQAVKTKDK